MSDQPQEEEGEESCPAPLKIEEDMDPDCPDPEFGVVEEFYGAAVVDMEDSGIPFPQKAKKSIIINISFINVEQQQVNIS